MPRQSSSFTVADVVARLMSYEPGVLKKIFADRAGMTEERWSVLTKLGTKVTPALDRLGSIGRALFFPPGRLFSPAADPFAERSGGLRWYLGGGSTDPQEHLPRLVGMKVVLGASLGEIGEHVHSALRSLDPKAKPLTEAQICDLAESAYEFGLVEPGLSPAGNELYDAELGRELSAALGRVSPDGRPPSVTVVRNLAHESFSLDPTARHLVGRVALRLVRSFQDGRNVRTIGLGGGRHVAAIVGSMGPATSPFPELLGTDKSYTILPLTMESAHEHELRISDSLAAEMQRRGEALLGRNSVRSPCFRGFGYMENGVIGQLKADPISHVRELFRHLDIILYGCGDPSDEGWVGHLGTLDLTDAERVWTDVLLHAFTIDAQVAPLKGEGLRREQVGISLAQVKQIVRSRTKLAVLVASGTRKGLPITLVAQAGCLDTLVCDQAAARAALEELEGRP